jgi:hypothetical protein
MSKRHTDIIMPLDLSDEEVVSDMTVLDQATKALDKDGWNTNGRWLRASWIVCIIPADWVHFTNTRQRLRYMSLRFREEVLEFSLTRLDESARNQLL